MMNDKFRAWDKKRNEWYGESDPEVLTFYGFAIFGECTLLCTPRAEDLQHLEITQYTGLKDKNGKEIYEGDVVALCGEVVAPVTFEDGAFQITATRQQGRSPFIQERAKRYEVIGNIYENPELLEAKE